MPADVPKGTQANLQLWNKTLRLERIPSLRGTALAITKSVLGAWPRPLTVICVSYQFTSLSRALRKLALRVARPVHARTNAVLKHGALFVSRLSCVEHTH